MQQVASCQRHAPRDATTPLQGRVWRACNAPLATSVLRERPRSQLSCVQQATRAQPELALLQPHLARLEHSDWRWGFKVSFSAQRVPQDPIAQRLQARPRPACALRATSVWVAHPLRHPTITSQAMRARPGTCVQLELLCLPSVLLASTASTLRHPFQQAFVQRATFALKVHHPQPQLRNGMRLASLVMCAQRAAIARRIHPHPHRARLVLTTTLLAPPV